MQSQATNDVAEGSITPRVLVQQEQEMGAQTTQVDEGESTPRCELKQCEEIDDTRAAQIQEISKLVAAQVEAKLSELERTMWQRGQVAFTQARKESQEQVEQLQLSLATCMERQEGLAVEHGTLRNSLSDVASKIDSMYSEVRGLQTFANVHGDYNYNSWNSQSSAPSVGTPSKQPPMQLLSLAEALDNGPATPPPKVSLTLSEVLQAESLGTVTPLTPAPSVMRQGTTTKTFDFVKCVIRKDDSKDLGLDVKSDGATLLVEKIDPEGVVAAYNTQQQSSSLKKSANNDEGEIKEGDRIIEVNGVRGDAMTMLEACRSNDVLRMTLSRVSEAVSPSSSTKMARRVLADELIRSLRPQDAAAPAFAPPGLAPPS